MVVVGEAGRERERGTQVFLLLRTSEDHDEHRSCSSELDLTDWDVDGRDGSVITAGCR